MDKLKKLTFLVNPDLFLHEETFNKLRDFVKNHDFSEADIYRFHFINLKNDQIMYHSTAFVSYDESSRLLDNLIINSEYILMNFENLKKFLIL